MVNEVVVVENIIQAHEGGFIILIVFKSTNLLTHVLVVEGFLRKRVTVSGQGKKIAGCVIINSLKDKERSKHRRK